MKLFAFEGAESEWVAADTEADARAFLRPNAATRRPMCVVSFQGPRWPTSERGTAKMEKKASVNAIAASAAIMAALIELGGDAEANDAIAVALLSLFVTRGQRDADGDWVASALAEVALLSAVLVDGIAEYDAREAEREAADASV